MGKLTAVTRLIALLSALAVAGAAALAATTAGAAGGPTRTSQQLKRDVLTGADMWARKPGMMAAGLGFTNIIGVPGDERR